MAKLLPLPRFREFDTDGAPLALGKVYTYITGTTTPLATYTDATQATANTNPVILDSAGYADIWLVSGSTYRIVIKDSTGTQLSSTDGVTSADGAAGAAGTFQMATAGGTVDAITATYSTVLTLSNLVTCGFVALGANATATPTFSPDGLTAHTITKRGGVALKPGDIPGALAVCILEYNSANTRWELLNPASDILGAEATLASNTTTDLGTAATNVVLISGTTTITSFGSNALTTRPIYFLRFSGILTLTHNGTSLIIPGAANITTANGDTAIADYLGSGNWKVLSYTRASGLPIVNPTIATTVSSQSSPADPTGTTNTTGLMMGLAGTITPLRTGKVMMIISGDVQNSSGAANQMKLQMRYGTGAAPANADALTGTAVGGLVKASDANGTYPVPFSLNAIVSGLTLSTAVWVDIGLAAVAGGTAAIKDVSISLFEI